LLKSMCYKSGMTEKFDCMALYEVYNYPKYLNKHQIWLLRPPQAAFPPRKGGEGVQTYRQPTTDMFAYPRTS